MALAVLKWTKLANISSSKRHLKAWSRNWWVGHWFFFGTSSNIQMSSLKSNFPLISAFGGPRVAKFCYKRARESQTFSFFHQWRHFSIPHRHQWKSEKAFWKKKFNFFQCTSASFLTKVRQNRYRNFRIKDLILIIPSFLIIPSIDEKKWGNY